MDELQCRCGSDRFLMIPEFQIYPDGQYRDVTPQDRFRCANCLVAAKVVDGELHYFTPALPDALPAEPEA